MTKLRAGLIGFLLVSVVGGLPVIRADAGTFRLLRAEEPTIADIHAAMKAGQLTCRQLVQLYLDRIDAYDKKGPALNSIITINHNALAIAEALDAKFAQGGLSGPLHCIPTIVKDNYNTFDLPTTAGSLSLKGSIPPEDAFQVRKMREAGAIVLVKSNMAEFAWSPFHTVGSRLPGYTRNPYALDRVPAGSSGGTVAAVAANFGAVGLGTDTGNSIRGPAAHTSLVGIRSTMGLTSRAGIVPLFLDRDIGGPLTRTVADAVAVFDVIAGYDPADPVTAASQGKKADNYAQFLVKDGLKGARIGVLRQLFDPNTTEHPSTVAQGADPDMLKLMEQAILDLRKQGAVIRDPVIIPDYDKLRTGVLGCDRFKYDLNNYLASLGPRAPVKNLEEVIKSRNFHPSIEKLMVDAQAVEPPPQENPKCQSVVEGRQRLREAVLKAMADANVEALIYPGWNNPPRPIGDLNTPHGNNSPLLSPPTGFPAIAVPMGFVRGVFPAGLQFLGEAWSEPTLIKLAYAYEQATKHRRPPPSVPPLPSER